MTRLRLTFRRVVVLTFELTVLLIGCLHRNFTNRFILLIVQEVTENSNNLNV